MPRSLYCCHVAIIDGEISEVSLSNYKGQYVILFFYPKVCLQDCLCRAACMLQSITLSRVACLLQPATLVLREQLMCNKVLCLVLQDFTFVCPTEIIAFSEKAQMFQQLNCQLIACSTDTEETHLAWIKTPRKKGGLGHMQIPIMADTTKVCLTASVVLYTPYGIPSAVPSVLCVSFRLHPGFPSRSLKLTYVNSSYVC